MGNPSVVRGNCRFCSADGGTWRHVGGRDSWWVCRAESDAAACGTACCDQRRSMQPPSCGWTDYSDPAGHRRLVARRCLLLVTTGRSWRSADAWLSCRAPKVSCSWSSSCWPHIVDGPAAAAAPQTLCLWRPPCWRSPRPRRSQAPHPSTTSSSAAWLVYTNLLTDWRL